MGDLTKLSEMVQAEFFDYYATGTGAVDWSRVRYFKPSEFVDPESMSAELVYRLDQARSQAHIPFVLTSTKRSGNGSHPKGTAVDIRCASSAARFKVVRSLLMAGFRRIGVYDRHVHADTDRSLPQDVMWHGLSQ